VLITLGGKGALGRSAIIDDADWSAVSAHRWHIHGAGYAASTIKINGAWKTKTLHRFILGLPTLAVRGCPVAGVVDHINGDKLDDRRCNLRVCTTALNNANGRPLVNCSSGVRGVHYDAQTGKWCASWMEGGKREWHRFATMAEAVACRAEFNARAYIPNADIRKSA
jgi:hypothetical protein